MRQITQSAYQFAVTLVGILVVLDGPPEDISQWWKPILTSLAAALAIWGGSKVKVSR